MRSLSFITFLGIVCLAKAGYQQYQSPQNTYEYIEPSETIKTDRRNDYKGNYVYGFETSDGIVQRQSGDASGAKRGYYSYVAPDGRTYTVCYIADEYGYRVVGDPMLGAVKEVQCPYDADKRRPVPFHNKQNTYNNKQQPIRRNGYGYDKPVEKYQAKTISYPLPETDPFKPPYY